jgi:acetyl-CoA C-acetyltransferase
MKEAVILSAVRTPVGKFQGSLQSFSGPRLGSLAVREALWRAGVTGSPKADQIHAATRALKLEEIDECIMGCVLQAGLGQNPARQAAIYGGLLPAVGAFTVNQVCGSGLKAVALAALAIQTGNAEIVVAGGMESMTNAPYLLPQARGGYRMGDGALVDSMIYDGLWEAYRGFHMGVGAEMIAAKYGITREQQDAFAAESHRRAAAATVQGCFRDEIVAVEIPAAKKGEIPRRFDADETIRPETTVEILARLKPAFQQDGTVTAGNAPGISDGAAALVVASAERARELGSKPLAACQGQCARGRSGHRPPHRRQRGAGADYAAVRDGALRQDQGDCRAVPGRRQCGCAGGGAGLIQTVLTAVRPRFGVSHPFARKKTDGWGTELLKQSAPRRSWRSRPSQLSGIEHRSNGSGHCDCLPAGTIFPEVLSFQCVAGWLLWHGKCYIPV